MRRGFVAGPLAVAVAMVAGACSSSGSALEASDAGASEDASAPDAAWLPTPGSDASPAVPEAGPADGGDATSRDAGGDAAAMAPTLSSLVVSTGTLRPSFAPTVTDYDITSLNAIYPVAVTATASDPSSSIAVLGKPATSGVASSVTLHAWQDLTVSVQAPGGGPSRTYTVHYLPSDFTAYSVDSAPGAGTEDVLLTPDGDYLLLADRGGAPLYYRTFAPNHVGDFKKQVLPDGSSVFTTEVGVFDARGWQVGVEHVMDETFNDIGDVQLLPNRSHGALPAEEHDFLMLDHDHYVAESYVLRTVDLSGLNPAWSAQAQVVNAVVQEVNAGSVVLEWDSGDIPSLYTDSIDGDNFTDATKASDYLHLNSMDVDPKDGNIILSFRHTNSIVELDRNTGQIVWTLGGAEDQFGLTADQVFSHQHYAKVQPDGTLWVFDNGNNLHQTRIISFTLDEVGKKVTRFATVYEKPSALPQTSFMGSYTQLPGGRMMFGWGGWATPDIEPSATEVSADGTVVWSLTLLAPQVFSYRAVPISTL